MGTAIEYPPLETKTEAVCGLDVVFAAATRLTTLGPVPDEGLSVSQQGFEEQLAIEVLQVTAPAAVLTQSQPCWISVAPASGASGPTAVNVSVVAMNQATAPRTDQITFKSGTYTLSVPATQLGASPPQILTTALPASYYYAPYSQTIAATGGRPPYSFSASYPPNQQAFWTINQGVLSNALPSAAVTVTLTVTDANNLSAQAVVPIANLASISRVGQWGNTPPASGGPFGTLTYNSLPGTSYIITTSPAAVPVSSAPFYMIENGIPVPVNTQFTGQHTFTMEFSANTTGGPVSASFSTMVYPGPDAGYQFENAAFTQPSLVLPLAIPGQQVEIGMLARVNQWRRAIGILIWI